MSNILIYGATGYSGRLIARAMVERGLAPILAGRDERRAAAVAEPLGLRARASRLSDRHGLDALLDGVDAVVHAAGPFSETAAPMLEACLRTQTHYLDITAEVRVIEWLASRHDEARRRGVMVMPGVGFDIVPSDCLAAHVVGRLPGAKRLRIGLRGLEFMTRGSAKALVEAMDFGVVRRGGEIVPVPLGSLEHRFDYGDGPRASVNISWGDVATAYYTTGVPDVETYYDATPLLRGALATSRAAGTMLSAWPWQVCLKAQADLLPEGPTDDERARGRMVVVAEAEDGRGGRASARISTAEAYSFTGVAAAAVAARVLGGHFEPGFQTPARVFGSDFALSLPSVTREDLA